MRLQGMKQTLLSIEGDSRSEQNLRIVIDRSDLCFQLIIARLSHLSHVNISSSGSSEICKGKRD